VTYLEDGDVAHVTDNGVTIYANGEAVERETHTVDWGANAAENRGYGQYKLKGINEKPRALHQTLSGRIDVLNAQVEMDVNLPAKSLESLEEIQIVAAGTSY
jgi:glucosamine--fructose-6-phosphate aminotransferase (isomerizing)